MKEKLFELEQVDKYLSGSLNKAEADEINQRMVEDAEFRKLVDDVEILREGIQQSAAKTSLETKLETLSDTLLMDEPLKAAPGLSQPSEESKNHIARERSFGDFFSQYKLAIAATLAFLIVTYFALTSVITPDPTALYAENFEPYAYQSVTRGDVAASDNTAAAYALYANGQYAEAAAAFERLIPDSENALKDKFYLGNAYLSAGEAQKAIPLFKEIIQESDSMKALAQWYLGLSYLKTDNVEAAKEAFEQVKAAGQIHAEDATRILKQLD